MSIILSPLYAGLATHRGFPGMEFHNASVRLSQIWLQQNRIPSAKKNLLRLMTSPVVLTRYQEFDFAWRHIPPTVKSYLDVSSPSIFPLRVIADNAIAQALLVNPDKTDLPTTEKLIAAGGLSERCKTASVLINDLSVANATFDLITSLSVVEHIPDNKPAIQKMWDLLNPGGTLLITVPCAAQAYELHTSTNHYGLINKDEHGYAFLEYLYDDDLLQAFIFSVTGAPQTMEIWGEVRPGFLREELIRRWSGRLVKHWEEPLVMGREFKRFDRIADLPGEGIVGLSFIKP